MDSNFIVLNWDKIEEKLNNFQLELFYELINMIGEGEREEDEYYVITRSEKEIKESEKKRTQDDKRKLIETLKELKELGDMELSHIEADEALLRFINDKEIEDAYESISKWYS